MREEQVRAAIQSLSGDKFERFARELVTRELYPGLNPTSDSHDLGEDARTERSTAFLHKGLRISLVISKEGNRTNLQADCQRCRETGRQIDVIVYVTAGNPRSDTIKKWHDEVKEQFNWELEVRALRWIAPVASRPDHESLVDDYLGIPPPGGDFTKNVAQEFSQHTERAAELISLVIPGLCRTLPRSEIDRVKDQLREGKPVMLTGEAGTGKSGVAACLARLAENEGKVVLLLDARRVAHIRDETELRQHLALNGPVASAVRRVGQHKGCLVIVDQLDNIAGSLSARILVETVGEFICLDGVEVVVVSRRQEVQESKLLEHLGEKGFVELTSFPLNEIKAAAVLTELGIPQPSEELVQLARNLLNLELIGAIKQQQPSLDFSDLTDEVCLWEQYIRTLLEREQVIGIVKDAEQIVAEAVKLAWLGMNSEDRSVCLAYPLSHHHKRLISWKIVIRENGRIYRFRHEKLQDYLCAWDATQRQAMPADVLGEINAHRSRNVFIWMDKIYSKSPDVHRRFMKEVFHVQ